MVQESEFNLDSEETLLYNAIKTNPINSQVYPVDIGVLANFQDNGVLTFTLPSQTTFSGNQYSASPVSIEAYSDTEYTWYGSLEGEEEGTVLLVAKDNRIDGRISVDSDIYLIQSVGEGKSVLIDVDESQFTVGECGVTISGSSGHLEDRPNVATTRNECTDLPIRILFLYTDAAAAVCSAGPVGNMIIAQLNQITKNSGINFSDDLRFSSAGVASLSSFTESPMINSDINLLSLPSTPPVLAYTDANNMRNSMDADLVVVFTDGNYSCGLGCLTLGTVQAGVAAPGVVVGGEALPFAIIEIDAAISNFTAVHEIGHLLGGRHQQCSEWTPAPDNPPFFGGCDDEPGDYEKLYLRLDVADATGEIVTAFYQVVFANDCGMCLVSNNSNTFQSAISKVKSSTIIYPNPASNITQIIFEVKKGEESNVSIALSDINGNLLENIPQGFLKEGKYFVNISLNNTASGMHFLKIRKGDKVESKKLFIAH